MRRAIPLHSGRAAAWVCAVCRNEAPSTRRALFSTTASLRNLTTTSRPTTAAQRTLPPATAPRRWSSRSAHAATFNESKPAPSPASNTNKPLPYYALFPLTLPDGPPPSGPFEIDVSALRREFLRLQAQSHPDFHHSSATRRAAEAASSEINAAFKTLCSPLLRAEYILRERYGVDLAGDESTGEDMEVVMTVLEAREAIDEAATEEELEEVRFANEERVGAAERAVGEALARGDVEGARRECVRLRYWLGIREGVEGWEKGKGGGMLHH